MACSRFLQNKMSIKSFASRYLVAIGAGLLLARGVSEIQPRRFRVDCARRSCSPPRTANRRATVSALGCVSGLAFWLASLYWLLLMPATGFPILGWLALAAFSRCFPGAWVWLVSNFEFQNSPI